MPRFLAVLTLILSGAAMNLRAAPAEQPPADPRAALLKLLPAGSKLDDLRPSPIPGIYEFDYKLPPALRRQPVILEFPIAVRAHFPFRGDPASSF